MRDQEATLVRADGVARSASPIGRSLKRSSATSLGLKSFAELTTPSAALRRLRAFFINAAATPSFSRRGMGPHGNSLSIHSHALTPQANL